MSMEIIAEVASNHGGDLALARQFIRRFADAGAHPIKFQATRVRHLRPDDPQHAWFTQAELADEDFATLKADCAAAGVGFLLTIYHKDDVALLQALGCTRVKLGAGEWSNGELFDALEGYAIVRSVPFHALGQVALGYATTGPWHDCLATVTRYPAPRRACEAAIQRMMDGLHSGYSDHSIGTEMAEWAIDCGAQIIEKHVQMDGQARPPKAFEATADEIRRLRRYVDDGPERFTGRWQHA
jgi:sialic acid synthase SpsE